MLQQIADLVEFDLKRFSPEQVIEDFNHKFKTSILKIDGQYYSVRSLEKDNKHLYLYTHDKKGNEIVFQTLNSIEKVMPKTGLYSSEHGLLYLYRLPNRQWIKSFSLKKNYDYKLLVNYNDPSMYNTVLVDKPLYDKESIIYKNNVYLHWKKMGKVVDKTIYVTDKKFLEEIRELWNQQYQIILDANNLLQKEEKLILDF